MENAIVPGMVVGFFAGLVCAFLVGFIANRIMWHVVNVRRIDQPQLVTIPTRETPGQVVTRGCTSLVFLLFLLFVVILLALFILSYCSLPGGDEQYYYGAVPVVRLWVRALPPPGQRVAR